MPEPFEYAIKKDVRNNTIVREVDEARQRDLWKSVAMAVLLVVVLLFSAWQHFELLQHGYRIEEMQRERGAEVSRQQSRTMDAAAKRGDILDRRGRVLATSVDGDSVYAVPSAIDDPSAVVAALCRALGDCKPAEREALIGKLGKTRAFAYVRRQVSPEQARAVAALNLDGIGLMKEDRRF